MILWWLGTREGPPPEAKSPAGTHAVRGSFFVARRVQPADSGAVCLDVKPTYRPEIRVVDGSMARGSHFVPGFIPGFVVVTSTHRAFTVHEQLTTPPDDWRRHLPGTLF